MQEQLTEIMARFGAETGTVHLLEGETLVLAGHVGVPPQVLLLIQRVPLGRGMAGLAAARNAPVDSCNLQIDTSGQVRPGAKQTGVNGALVVPIRDRAGNVRGTLGIGVRRAHVYGEDETGRLLGEAAALARA